jgi:hypothetical protein
VSLIFFAHSVYNNSISPVLPNSSLSICFFCCFNCLAACVAAGEKQAYYFVTTSDGCWFSIAGGVFSLSAARFGA